MLQCFCWAARNCKRAGASRKHRYKVEQRLPSIWPSRAISDRDWQTVRIGQLHDDDIWLQLPAEFISVLLCYINLSIPLRIKESKWNSVSICKWNSVSTSKWNSGGGGVVVYRYTRKKFAKIPQNTQNASKYTLNYTQVYFIPEIQRKSYTEYPYLSCNIPYTRFKKPLYTVYPKTLADPAFYPRGNMFTVYVKKIMVSRLPRWTMENTYW